MTIESTMKLPEVIKRKWIDALRSGEYEQGTGTLYNPETGGFCCLGVLQHVTNDGQVECDVFGQYLPDATPSYWREINAMNYHHTVNQLVHQNDFLMRSFNEIADYIEENVKGY